ncbi:CIR protein [Plasmodium chabaudi chabaudi]|uniref:CIR protein n=1 Tax=Plasmodium chabaudi chabaudi TaxID=31271 RepID=Q7YZ87_PLACU|nr:CIR protein [Plasmodium chabaudi chabaudi]AAO06129.1 PC10103c [Plasmodium chabaudi chabaudi]VTZ68197.1 CIR protein [Plasmodium chabaudi chabaudi]|eukprot:XP_016652868.1 CIR protein [Plasmodium chabaudi chabaudi]
MSEKLCKLFSAIDNGVTVTVNNSKAMIKFDNIFTEYCYGEEDGGKKECFSYEVLVTSYFIGLLNYFMKVDDLKHNKNAEYAILWLCHKLNKNSQNKVSNIKYIYDAYIKENEKDIEKISGAEAYNSCKDIINKKIYSMSFDIKEMSRLYEALKALCKLYTECNEKKKSYTNCSKDAQDFAKHFEGLNQDSNITGNSSYREILYNLFNDYDHLKTDCAEKCTDCKDIPTLSEVKAPPSSSIAKTLIPVLLTFAIPVFLGIAYKYSLFGFDKRVQRQNLREKPKKIKKKMNHYI